ncbi:uncharacterized protein [Clytia hemisphaerica]|uniref:uncharacterized protein n=1 Tax=Clytia hemisphaerica TaxID=252671 RepID=UPI0034D76702
MDPAIFLGADTPICAINVSPSATQDQGAKLHPQQPVHHSDLYPTNSLPEGFVTPVNIKNFSSALLDHPDQETCKYLIDGLTYGFDIGYTGPHSASKPKNLKSSLEHTDAVTIAVCKELKHKHTYNLQFLIYTSHHSVQGKKKDGTRRLIMDLSQPTGESINEGIDKEDFTVKYANFDQATELFFNSGKNCLMTKIDIQRAFHLLPVQPSQ